MLYIRCCVRNIYVLFGYIFLVGFMSCIVLFLKYHIFTIGIGIFGFLAMVFLSMTSFGTETYLTYLRTRKNLIKYDKPGGEPFMYCNIIGYNMAVKDYDRKQRKILKMKNKNEKKVGKLWSPESWLTSHLRKKVKNKLSNKDNHPGTLISSKIKSNS